MKLLFLTLLLASSIANSKTVYSPVLKITQYDGPPVLYRKYPYTSLQMTTPPGTLEKCLRLKDLGIEPAKKFYAKESRRFDVVFLVCAEAGQ